MRILKCLFAVAVVLFVSSTALAQASAPKLSDFGWLAGCWEMQNEKRGLMITEMWMKPAGDAMLGVGRTMKAGKLIDFEFLRIVQNADEINYISRPSANKEDTAFKSIRVASNEAVFENPRHDFPQRIIYKRDGDKLHARIEGTAGGKTRGIDFGYARIKCE